MKPIFKLFIVFSIVILLGLLVLFGVSAQIVQSAPSLQPAEGACDELQLIFIVDQSGSMSREKDKNAGPASDPEGLRFFGPAKAIETLSSLRYQTYQTATIRVAMVHFGDQTKVGLPWTNLTPGNQAEHQKLQQDLAPSFKPIGSMGNTNVLAAFQTASSLLDQATPQIGSCPGRVIILLTDGIPYIEQDGFTVGGHMKELADYVKKYMPPPGHQIYVIGIDKPNAYWDTIKEDWDKVTGDPNKVVRARDQAEMGTLIIGIVEQASRILKMSGAEAKMECITGGTLSVPPFVQEIKLTLVKPSPELHLDILDETGRKLEPSRSDVTVKVDGYTDPIETLIVSNPPPGLWKIQTMLPVDASERCQIRKLSFNAVGKLLQPDSNSKPRQFTRMPVSMQIVDTAGGALPVYSDPKYDLVLETTLFGSTKSKQLLTLTATPGSYQYTGEAIPLESGPNSLQVKAMSHNPDSSDYTVFDKVVATFPVEPVRFMMTESITGVVAQHYDQTLKFAVVDSKQQPVKIDLTPMVTTTLTYQNDTHPLELVTGADGTYQVTFRPDEAGRYVLIYQATVDTPNGPMSVGEDEIAFDVFPTKKVEARIVSPTDEHYVATDLFLRSTGLPLQVQLVDETGREVGPGEIGAANPMDVLKLQLLDADNNDVGTNLRLENTGKPGLFRLQYNSLGPGQYQIKLSPTSTLSRDYVWGQKTWNKTVVGDVNPLFYTMLGLSLVALAALIVLVWTQVKARQHPLSGYIKITQEQPTQDIDTTYHKTVYQKQLPKRNRVVLNMGRAGIPIKRIHVACATEEDSKAGRAEVKVEFTGGNKPSAILSPEMQPVPLGLGYFIEKGPRKMAIGDPAEVSGDFSEAYKR